MQNKLKATEEGEELFLHFFEKLTLYDITTLEHLISKYFAKNISQVVLDLEKVEYIDTAFGIFLLKIEEHFQQRGVTTTFLCDNISINSTLELVRRQKRKREEGGHPLVKKPFSENFFSMINDISVGIVSFLTFFGQLIMTQLYYLKSFKNIRYKEIAFEINESAIRAIGIVSLTSFLIGLVVAYQSAYQLKSYGANIFIVDMLGISILRELAPLITAIVIAGRSGSAFTAQIGAMKITQEIDAMKSMGFDPFAFLVLPRIIALMITLPILIFIADMMGMFGGMLVSNLDLGISTQLFLDRFREVVDVKHFYIGILKGPFFAFLIASIGIYRGLSVKDDTQSIGFNTTKSVVESIFAVIVCDALFSIIFTNLGI